MEHLKYIVYDSDSGEVPIIFDQNTQHDEMAKALGIERHDIVSAGFLMITEKGARCYGSSSSLGITSRRAEDHNLINKKGGMDD